ncbi:hypothetical protein Vretimale_16482 [Volvox reticuliferus]|nr:hypothetical protein Vretifemale_17527 [Volvox reticuliferus]GIM13430.1 hypothetical protein Vretimale_16482 [Volvox reticuliferus]
MRQLLEAIADSTTTASDVAQQQAVATGTGASTAGATTGTTTTVSGAPVSSATAELAVTSTADDSVAGACARNGLGSPDVATVPVDVAATLQLPARGSPLAAFEEEEEEEEGDGQERKQQEGEGGGECGSYSAAAAAATGTTRAQLREPQHAVILSDANSLFIPWILDGGGGAIATTTAACNGTAAGGEAIGTYAAPGCTAKKAIMRETEREGATTWSSTGEEAAPHRQRPLSSAFLGIHTNPAAVDPVTGAVHVSPYHGVDPGSVAPPHSCPRCHPNLCKRSALRRLLDEQATRGVSYRQVVYVGDGRNDLCPCLALRRNDVVMPRIGFALHTLLLVPCNLKSDSTTAGLEGSATNTNDTERRDAEEANNANCKKSHSDATQSEGWGDDHVYGTASGPTSGSMQAARRQHGAVAPPSVVSAGGVDERLQAACVPWADAYDILRWVYEQEAAQDSSDKEDRNDLATQARTLAL